MVLPYDREGPGKRRAILIAGPTASGKSALALALARRLGGAVVNADSMQVYRDLHILTARPEPVEEASVPHRLYGHVDGATNYSVGRWLAEATATLDELWGRALLPILTGGTGLYFKALTEGLSPLPPIPDQVRSALRAWADGQPTPELHVELARRDPASAARLRPSDRLRVLRAIEIHEATGLSLASLQGARTPGPLAGAAFAAVFLTPDRAALRQRIDRRFEAMLQAGALDEVRALAARGLDPALPVMRAHGVSALLAHLRGETALAEAVARGQADTRAYVKRQFTWFRGQMPDFVATTPGEALDRVTAQLSLDRFPSDD